LFAAAVAALGGVLRKEESEIEELELPASVALASTAFADDGEDEFDLMVNCLFQINICCSYTLTIVDGSLTRKETGRGTKIRRVKSSSRLSGRSGVDWRKF
jgi:hypothetical protein